MKRMIRHATTAVLLGLFALPGSGAVLAESNTALQHAALRAACAEQSGRFEKSWAYNDQGVRWGEILTCSTSFGQVTCQDNLCRSARWVVRSSAMATVDGSGSGDSGQRFVAEPRAFSAALAALSRE